MKKRALIVILTLLLIAISAPIAAADSPDDSCREMLVNKVHMLEPGYVPSSLVRLSNYIRSVSSVMMTREAAEAMQVMVEAMAAEGITDIFGQSGYRSYDTQTYLYNNKVSYYRNLGYDTESARTLAGQVVAKPGASEHQTGLALDFSTSRAGLNESFGQTAAGQWLAVNSWRYGYILRYPAGKELITGYIYEPWHFRYIGRVHAEYMYKNDLTLEEYYDLLASETVLTYMSEDGISYAVYLTQYNNADGLSGSLLSWSRAYADQPLGFVITTLMPQVELFDIVGHWGEKYIRPLAELQLVDGYPNNTFRPDKSITRAELITLTARVYELLYPRGLDRDSREYIEEMLNSGSSPFGDVAPGAYYLVPLLQLEQAGLLPPTLLLYTGDTMPLFLPDQAALRSEAALTMSPLFRDEEPADSGIRLGDMYEADPDLQAAVQLLVDAGVLTGNGSGNFAPSSNITRAEICAMLCRVLVYFEFLELQPSPQL